MDLGRDLRVLVFDFDGTLFHLDLDWAAARRSLGIEATPETLGAALQRLAAAGDPRLAEIGAREVAAVGDRRVDPDTVEVLRGLAVEFRLAVFTRNSGLAVRQAFAGTELAADLFIVGREDTARHKPDPEGLRRILGHFTVTPEEAVLVGDTYHDVQAAHAAGVRCVVVDNARLAYRPPGADHYLHRLRELPSVLTAGIWKG